MLLYVFQLILSGVEAEISMGGGGGEEWLYLESGGGSPSRRRQEGLGLPASENFTHFFNNNFRPILVISGY